MLGSGLFRRSRHATDALLLVDGLPEGLGHLAALQPVDHLKDSRVHVMVTENRPGPQFVMRSWFVLRSRFVFTWWTDLGELLEGELLAGLGHLLDDLADPVARQRQVSDLEELGELILADEAVVVDVWKRRGQRSKGPHTGHLCVCTQEHVYHLNSEFSGEPPEPLPS